VYSTLGCSSHKPQEESLSDTCSAIDGRRRLSNINSYTDNTDSEISDGLKLDSIHPFADDDQVNDAFFEIWNSIQSQVSSTATPTLVPTTGPTSPSATPTLTPSTSPSVYPTYVPTVKDAPTIIPTTQPTRAPTNVPTVVVTVAPSAADAVGPPVEAVVTISVEQVIFKCKVSFFFHCVYALCRISVLGYRVM